MENVSFFVFFFFIIEIFCELPAVLIMKLMLKATPPPSYLKQCTLKVEMKWNYTPHVYKYTFLQFF